MKKTTLALLVLGCAAIAFTLCAGWPIYCKRLPGGQAEMMRWRSRRLMVEVCTLRHEQRVLKNTLEAAQEKHKCVADRLASERKTNEALREQVQKMMAQEIKHVACIENHDQDLAASRAEAQKREQEITKLQASGRQAAESLADLQAAHKEATEKQAQMAAGLADAEKRVSASNRKVAELGAQLTRLEGSLAAETNKNGALASQVQGLRRDLEQARKLAKQSGQTPAAVVSTLTQPQQAKKKKKG